MTQECLCLVVLLPSSVLDFFVKTNVNMQTCFVSSLYFWFVVVFPIRSAGNKRNSPHSKWLQSGYLGAWGYYACYWRET